MGNGAGRATRLELYGSLTATAVIVVCVWERLAIDRAIINEMIRDGTRPNIVQNNNQTVTVEKTKTREDLIEAEMKRIRDLQQ